MDIKRFLHFVDNSTLVPPGTVGYDKLGQSKPTCRTGSSQCYTLGQHIAVDEAMIKFQGRSSLKQYMPKKPTRRGFKVWVLGDSSTGYFCRLEVYTSKKDTGIESGLVVLELTSAPVSTGATSTTSFPQRPFCASSWRLGYTELAPAERTASCSPRS